MSGSAREVAGRASAGIEDWRVAFDRRRRHFALAARRRRDRRRVVAAAVTVVYGLRKQDVAVEPVVPAAVSRARLPTQLAFLLPALELKLVQLTVADEHVVEQVTDRHKECVELTEHMFVE